jgi:hypothetical protein
LIEERKNITTISEPRKEPVPPRKRPAPNRGVALRSRVNTAVLKLQVGWMIEITDPQGRVATNALRAAQCHGVEITTHKTVEGTLKIWRLS